MSHNLCHLDAIMVVESSKLLLYGMSYISTVYKLYRGHSLKYSETFNLVIFPVTKPEKGLNMDRKMLDLFHYSLETFPGKD